MTGPGVQHRCQLVVCTPCPIIPVPQDKGGGTRLAPVSMQWHRHRMALNVPYGYNAAELACDGYEIGQARTMVVEKCRHIGADWLLFVDYDVLVPPYAFKQLMYRATVTHQEFDVFAGVYCVKEHPTIPIIYKGWGHGACWDWTLGDVLAEGIVGVPMGCTLLRLSLFDRLTNTPEKPWFKTHDLSEGNPLDHSTDGLDVRGTVTEDLWFCKRAVEEAGCKLLVDTRVVCGHISHDTGEIFNLPEDCPPVVRAGIKPLENDTLADIKEHLPKLKELAAQCKVVVEFGVRDGNSTRAFLEARPAELWSYDLEYPGCLQELQLLATREGVRFAFVQEDVETTLIPACDLLLEDARHTAAHVAQVLARYAGWVRRWIALHDTTSYGERGEDGGPGILTAIRGFLAQDHAWRVSYESAACNGLTILERVDAGA